jgi:hypothetical protein
MVVVGTRCMARRTPKKGLLSILQEVLFISFFLFTCTSKAAILLGRVVDLLFGFLSLFYLFLFQHIDALFLPLRVPPPPKKTTQHM